MWWEHPRRAGLGCDWLIVMPNLSCVLFEVAQCNGSPVLQGDPGVSDIKAPHVLRGNENEHFWKP